MEFLAQTNNFGDTRSGGLAGPMGLFVVVLMVIATVLLIRNMNKRLRRLPDSFPDARETQREAEVARQATAPAGAGSGPVPRNVEEVRSEASGPATEGKLKGITTDSDDPRADGDAGRV